MAEASQSSAAPQFDRILLDRMTGELGDGPTIEKLCTELAGLYVEFLPDVFHAETGFEIEVHVDGFKSGPKQDLVAGLGETVAMCDGSLRGWCPEFTLACGSTFAMTLMEAMLGAPPEMIEPPQDRALSRIELDLTEMIFTKVANVLRTAIATGGNYEPVLGKPYNGSERPKPPDGYRDPHAVLLTMSVTLGKTDAQFHLVVPQRNFLKTRIVTARSAANGRAKPEWTDQIKEQVQRSQVAVEARINLQPLSLGTISRLQVGDVIPFEDLGDVKVQVNANGKELYFGEFGRSGARYTVRVTDTYSTDSDILEHLMG